MKILVIGANGPTGIALVQEALAHRHDVTALVRKPDAMPIHNEWLRVVKGDVLDPASLEPAIVGQEAVVCSLGITLAQSRKPTTIYSDGTKNIIAAMDKAGGRRLICITGIGTGDSKGHGGFLYDNIFLPLLLSEGYKDKGRQEEVVRASHVDWTIIRPAQLTNAAPKGTYRIFDTNAYTAKSIARADVAAFIVAHISDDTYLHKTIGITY